MWAICPQVLGNTNAAHTEWVFRIFPLPLWAAVLAELGRDPAPGSRRLNIVVGIFQPTEVKFLSKLLNHPLKLLNHPPFGHLSGGGLVGFLVGG